jgi:endogenous inhibitor of DNA gyrase (YacG/DUF329 family)
MPPACPICRRPVVAQYRPFCSVRCAEIDLGRWFAEDYRIIAPAPDDSDPDAGSDDDNFAG